jgi:hypothetical protein
MIPISIIDQVAALIKCREKMEAAPNAAWNAYIEGHYGPERAAAQALDAEERKQAFQFERRQIINALNLPAGVTPIWKHYTSVEIVGFKATLVAPTHGNRRVGEFKTAEEAAEAINAIRERLDVDVERRIKLTQATLPQQPNKSGLPSGVIKRETKKGDRFSAVICVTHPDGKRFQKMVGTFDNPEEAHRAYQIEHIKINGERSRYWSKRHELKA